jgi:hypothetical protein
LIVAMLAVCTPQTTRAQQANRSTVIPFRKYVDPTQTPKKTPQQAAKKHNAGIGIGPQGNATTDQRPWESQDGPLGAKTLENARIIARVGPEVILAGEILTTVDRIMEENRAQIPEKKWDEIRRSIMEKMLIPMIEEKMIVVAALQVIPEEAIPGIEEQVDKQFYGGQIKGLMARAKVTSPSELEAKLKESGSSIELQKQIFFERSMAAQWIQQQVVDSRPITHQEMLEYYSARLENYDQPGRCRWEQLSVRFDKFSSKQAAFDSICKMGNRVADKGVPLETVAREESQGLSAASGGIRDWTTRGALVSRPLDQAIFTLPVGQLSEIIEDNTGFHIVRVSERVAAHRTPFRDAQVKISEAIVAKRREAKMKEYLQSLRKKIPVWTMFDDVPSAGPESAGPESLAAAKQGRAKK